MTVVGIFDDDYGCEERPENEELHLLLQLEENGAMSWLRVPETDVLFLGIEEGCQVKVVNGKIRMAG